MLATQEDFGVALSQVRGDRSQAYEGRGAFIVSCLCLKSLRAGERQHRTSALAVFRNLTLDECMLLSGCIESQWRPAISCLNRRMSSILEKPVGRCQESRAMKKPAHGGLFQQVTRVISGRWRGRPKVCQHLRTVPPTHHRARPRRTHNRCWP